MANVINATSTGNGGLVSTGDDSGILNIQTNETTAITVDASQRVGIGTTSPNSKLQVGTGAAASTVQAQILGGVTVFENSGATTTVPTITFNNDLDTGINNPGANLLAFYTAGAERMRIDSSGNLQLGYGGSSPTAATAPQGLSLTSSANTALQIYMLKQTQVEAHIGFKSSTDTNFYVGTSGGGGPSGIGAYGVYQQNVTNSWTSVSDERVKTELQPIENALEKVKSVRTVTGRFIYDEINGVTRRLPFLIAQDFLTALPEAVDQQDPDKLGLSYSDTIVLAFAAIKELKAINDTQAETINALTARIVALEAK